jgi:hypothetical protein
MAALLQYVASWETLSQLWLVIQHQADEMFCRDTMTIDVMKEALTATIPRYQQIRCK